MIVSALERDYELLLWEHPAFWPRSLRISTVALRAALGGLKRPDLVIYDHVHLAVLHTLMPTLRGIPYAVFLHGVEVWEPLSGRRREALLGATLLLTNSATTQAQARRFNPWLPKVEVTWLGVPDQPQPVDLSASPTVGLMVGRILEIERYKGHDTVISAWPIIRAAVPGAELKIVGKGNDEDRLRQRVKDERLEGIEFCGRLSDAQRDQMYRSCRLLFFPSKGEGFGLAGVEAASFGVPFLGLASTVTEELFPNGTGAVLAKDMERESIAEAAIPVLADAQYAAKLGSAARARVQALFLLEHFMERFRQALSPLISPTR
jgi:phosphatidylinositol alpha-1,6-mannosyltransferase